MVRFRLELGLLLELGLILSGTFSPRYLMGLPVIGYHLEQMVMVICIHEDSIQPISRHIF